MSAPLADVAIPVPLDQTFTYTIPADLQLHVRHGVRVLVPFGRKFVTGVVVGLPEETKVRTLKPIKDVLDDTPSFTEELLTLCSWISEYYFAPLGEVLKAASPRGLSVESKRIVKCSGQSSESSPQLPTKRQQAIIQLLKSKQALTVSQIRSAVRIQSIHATLNEMEKKGWINIEEEITRSKVKPKKQFLGRITEPGRAALSDSSGPNGKLTAKRIAILRFLDGHREVPVREILEKTRASLSSVKLLAKHGLLEILEREVLRAVDFENVEPLTHFLLNQHQQKALDTLTKALHTAEYKTFLLLGVTGSGKTQVYIEAIRIALSRGKTAIVLVPEISLTPQTVRRFKAHFGNDVAVMHSQMSLGERYDAWRQAREGKTKIVIGPRSAVFAPLHNLGLIVVDEEQEASYKQFDSMPRYNAREVAIVRARHNNAAVLLGSATPSAESMYNALSGKYGLLELPERVDNAQLPRIDLVDMTKERKRVFEELRKEVKEQKKDFPTKLPASSVSQLLREQIAERLRRKEGVIVLQNRRGFSHVVECPDCGYVEKCGRCDVSLTYHQTKKHLRCHYCGFVKTPPAVCPECGGADVRFHSYGTQQVQEELEQLFPRASILRMDLDTTSRKGAHDRLLRRFASGEADILLGTQMVAKGLDFPRVTLVGVISADTQMLLPDFRASERTFQLLTQVAGRAGRSDLAGEVVIQTNQPAHYSLHHVLTHDVMGFYKQELEYRRELDYPPFSRIVLVEFSGETEGDVYQHTKKFADYLESINRDHHFKVLGPADAAIPKIKDQYRKHVIIKGLRDVDPSGARMRSALSKARRQYETSDLGKKKSIRLTIDVDPQGMM
ncbi:MAG: primosomal protein N' [Ignavibacteriales bacterium]|nr:primosomal protein N' [Ignavibacteriales bacterium]